MNPENNKKLNNVDSDIIKNNLKLYHMCRLNQLDEVNDILINHNNLDILLDHGKLLSFTLMHNNLEMLKRLLIYHMNRHNLTLNLIQIVENLYKQYEITKDISDIF